MSAFVGYSGEHIKIGLQDSWQSSYSLQVIPSKPANYLDLTIAAFNTFDLSIEGKLEMGGGTISPYLSIQNLFNAQPDILPASGSIGLNYPVPANTDIMGRYFTMGVKARF
jgi:outer membrane receptor protein involved in Fe transport